MPLMDTFRAILARYAELAPAALPGALALAGGLLLATLVLRRFSGSRPPAGRRVADGDRLSRAWSRLAGGRRLHLRYAQN
jgi:hypothetical protein